MVLAYPKALPSCQSSHSPPQTPVFLLTPLSYNQPLVQPTTCYNYKPYWPLPPPLLCYITNGIPSSGILRCISMLLPCNRLLRGMRRGLFFCGATNLWRGQPISLITEQSFCYRWLLRQNSLNGCWRPIHLEGSTPTMLHSHTHAFMKMKIYNT